MSLAGYPGLLAGFGAPFLNTSPLITTGKMFFVSSVTGKANNAGTDSLYPMATLAQAFAKCRANKGDHIILLPGHVETVIAAGGITLGSATPGVTIIGMGFGAQRPTFTFSTVAGASLLISAADTKISNIVGVSGVNLLTGPIDIEASGCAIDMEWQDPTSSLQAVEPVVVAATASVSNLYLKLRILGQTTGGTSPVDGVKIGGTGTGLTTAQIVADFYGRASTAYVQFAGDTAAIDVQVTGQMYNAGVTSGAKNLVDTVTGSTWSINVFDATAGQFWVGSSGLAAVLGGGGSSGINSTSITVPAADATTNTLERDVIGNKLDAAVTTVPQTQKSLMGFLKGVVTLVGVLVNSGGTASLGGILGDVANSDIATRLTNLANQAVRTTAKKAISGGISTANLFTVTGGAVRVLNVTGHIVTTLAATGDNVKLVFTDTLTSTATDICAVLDLNGKLQGTFLNITGTFANAMTNSATKGVVLQTLAAGLVLAPGVLSMNAATPQATGAIDWYIEYEPMAPGAAIA
jgi:hypothetical protein